MDGNRWYDRERKRDLLFRIARLNNMVFVSAETDHVELLYFVTGTCRRVFMYYPQREKIPARVRQFIDFVVVRPPHRRDREAKAGSTALRQSAVL